LLEARASGAGGDFARALRVGREIADDPRLPPADREFLRVALASWEHFRLGESDEVTYLADEDIQARILALGVAKVFSKPPGPDASSDARLLHSLSGHSLAMPNVLNSYAPPGTDPASLARSTASDQASEACGGKPPCFWGELLAGSLLAAAGLGPEAEQRLARARDLALRDHDDHLAARAVLALGDLYAAPHGSPFDLDLEGLRLVRESVARGAGTASPLVAPVDAARLAKGAALYAEARQLFEKAGSPRGVAHVQARTAYLEFARDRPDAAAEGFAAAGASFEQLGDVLGARRCALARVVASLSAGDFAGARAEASAAATALRSDEATGLARASVRLWLAMGPRFKDRHKARAAVEAASLAKDLARRMSLHHAAGVAAEALASEYSELGRHKEALSELLAAQDEWQAFRRETGHEGGASDLADESRVVVALLYELTALRDERRAEWIVRLRELAAKTDNPIMRQMLESDAEATALTLDPRDVRGTKDPRLLALADLAGGRLQSAREKADSLATNDLRLLRALKAGGNDLALQQVRYDLEEDVTILIRAEAYERAAKVWQAVDGERSDWLFTRKPWEAPAWRAEIAAHGARPADAEALLRTAIERIERSSAAAGTLRERQGFYDDTQWVYRAWIRTLLALHRDAAAIDAFEASRARGFREQLRVASEFVGDDARQDTYRNWSETHAALEAVQGEILAADAVRRPDLEKQRSELAARAESLDAKVAPTVDSMGVASTDSGVADVARHAAASLDPAAPTALVVYGYLVNEVWAWVIDRTGLRATRLLSKDGARVQPLVSEFTQLLKAGDPRAEDRGRALFELLVRPIEGFLPPARETGPKGRIGIVPSGPLALLPFHALSSSRGPWIRDHDFFYAPTVSAYVAALQNGARRKRPTPPEIQTFALDTLPHALPEALTVARGRGAAPLAGDRMSIEAFRLAATKPGILHLTTHGWADISNPFYSSLEFSRNERLHAFEILGMSFEPWLVALTACDTNRPELTPTDEPTTLGDAFLLTGVPDVVVSAWRVYDGTVGSLADAFYSRLWAGEPVVAALSGAQRELAVQGVPAKYWATLSLRGADR
jgi:CHAT domain-containing protein